MVMSLLAWLRNILVTIMMSMSSSLWLVVFFVIVCKVILPGGWLSFAHLRNILS